jgi:hypothetical protein
MPIKPPPDKPDRPSPLPPVNDGIQKPMVPHVEAEIPAGEPKRKEPPHGIPDQP